MAAGAVVSCEYGAEVETLADDGAHEGGGRLHGHGGALLHGVDGDLALHVADHELGIADDSGDGHPDVV